jgi:hypothetical protein
MRIGTLAWRCKESFWLSETVSKHRTAPVDETIQGRTFSFDTLETTSNLDALFASLYRLLSPDLVEGALSSPSITEEMKIKPCRYRAKAKQTVQNYMLLIEKDSNCDWWPGELGGIPLPCG